MRQGGPRARSPKCLSGHAFQIATPEYTVTAALGIVSNTAIMKYPVRPFTWASSNAESA